LTDKQREDVKKVCKSLLEKLKAEKLVLDWREKAATRGAVRQAIELELDRGLPEVYDETIYEDKCHAAFAHIFSSYPGGGASIYSTLH
jgi:type I restriction enzyme R subunit